VQFATVVGVEAAIAEAASVRRLVMQRGVAPTAVCALQPGRLAR
jgi:hypothetical protein